MDARKDKKSPDKEDETSIIKFQYTVPVSPKEDSALLVKKEEINRDSKSIPAEKAWFDSACKIEEFVEKSFVKLGFKQRLPWVVVSEIVKNSFDSFAKKDTLTQTALTLNVIVKKQKNKVIIKIKDNGYGFSDKPKSSFFTYEEISPTRKVGLFGGCRVGIPLIANRIKELGGIVKFKNREQEGASVLIALPISGTLTLPPPPPLPKPICVPYKRS